jgi:hypothetical protein
VQVPRQRITCWKDISQHQRRKSSGGYDEVFLVHIVVEGGEEVTIPSKSVGRARGGDVPHGKLHVHGLAIWVSESVRGVSSMVTVRFWALYCAESFGDRWYFQMSSGASGMVSASRGSTSRVGWGGITGKK